MHDFERFAQQGIQTFVGGGGNSHYGSPTGFFKSFAAFLERSFINRINLGKHHDLRLLGHIHHVFGQFFLNHRVITGDIITIRVY